MRGQFLRRLRLADAWLADQHGESALRRRDVHEHRLQLL
jgi:hypothetical protein